MNGLGMKGEGRTLVFCPVKLAMNIFWLKVSDVALITIIELVTATG